MFIFVEKIIKQNRFLCRGVYLIIRFKAIKQNNYKKMYVYII